MHSRACLPIVTLTFMEQSTFSSRRFTLEKTDSLIDDHKSNSASQAGVFAESRNMILLEVTFETTGPYSLEIILVSVLIRAFGPVALGALHHKLLSCPGDNGIHLSIMRESVNALVQVPHTTHIARFQCSQARTRFNLLFCGRPKPLTDG